MPQIYLIGFNSFCMIAAHAQIISRSYFGTEGIGYTFVRIPIAGTDFSTRPYTYDDTPDDITLSDFKLVEEDDYKIGYLLDIKNMMKNPDSLRIFTTAWTAPAWMKNTNSITWGKESRIFNMSCTVRRNFARERVCLLYDYTKF